MTPGACWWASLQTTRRSKQAKGLGPRASGLGRQLAPAIGLLLGGLFLWTALQKAIDPRDTLAVGEYLFGEGSPLVRPFLYGLILSEIVLASLLITGIARRRVMLATIALLLVFSAWLAYLKITNAPVSCGCGANPKFLRDEALFGLARNSVLIALAALACRMSRSTNSDPTSPSSADSTGEGPRQWGAVDSPASGTW